MINTNHWFTRYCAEKVWHQRRCQLDPHKKKQYTPPPRHPYVAGRPCCSVAQLAIVLARYARGPGLAGRPCGSVALLARMLARYERGPGFEFRSGRVLFPPLWNLVVQYWSVLGLRAAKGPSRRYRHGSEQIPGRIYIKEGGIVAGRPCGSVAQLARVLARYARGLGFESRSGRVLFPPLWHSDNALPSVRMELPVQCKLGYFPQVL